MLFKNSTDAQKKTPPAGKFWCCLELVSQVSYSFVIRAWVLQIDKQSEGHMSTRDTLKTRSSTKEHIIAALTRLLEDTPYQEIKIKQICAEAYISKPTFYRHFQNKDSILCWVSQEAIKYGVAGIGRKYSWLEGCYRTAVFFYRYGALFSRPQTPEVTTTLITSSSELIRSTFVETLKDYKNVKLTEQLLFQIDSLCFSQGYMTRSWAEDGMRISPKTFAGYIVSTVPSELHEFMSASS